MTRIIGFLLGISYQTELLIMTLLGLANSALDWKPFELVPRLNLIRDLNFSNSDGIQFSNSLTIWIKKLLRITVVIEFICSLLNPFAYLLKLYPIITWSRSNILLPWLVTHALNTILPKMLSVSLAFVFYSANKISTLKLFEFMVIESINLLIASYNWYVFFAFYLDLREVDRKRDLRKSQMKISPNCELSPRNCSSIPNIEGNLCESSTDSNNLSISRSFSSSTDTITPSHSLDENLLPFEETLKVLNLTRKDYKNARIAKGDIATSIFSKLMLESQDSISENSLDNEESDSSIDRSKNSCSCSSSDNENTVTLISRKTQSCGVHDRDEAQINSLSGTEICHKRELGTKQKKKIDRVTQANIERPLSNHANFIYETKDLSDFTYNVTDDHQNLNSLLRHNFEVLEQICKTTIDKRISSPNSSTEKWLTFQHELESHLNRNLFFKQSNVVENLRLDSMHYNSVEAGNQMENERNDIVSHNSTLHLLKQESNRNNWYYVDDTTRHYQKNHDVSRNQIKAYNIPKVISSPLNKFNEVLKMNSFSFQTKNTLGVYPTSTKSYVNKIKSKKTVYRMSKTNDPKSTKQWAEYKKYNRGKEYENFADCRSIPYNQNIRDFSLKRRKSKVDHLEDSQKYSKRKKDGEFQEFCNKLEDDRKMKSCLFQSKDKSKSMSQREQKHNKKRDIDGSKVQTNQLDIKEIISKIDWNVNSSSYNRSGSSRNIQTSNLSQIENNSTRYNVIDDEDLHMLRSAFSFSDQSQRTYNLGPESNGPYPIFQTVDISVTDIFKATGWRSLDEILNSDQRNDIQAPDIRNFNICGSEMNDIRSRECRNNVNTPRNANEDCSDEIERKQSTSACLVKHLQELLDSSQKTLSAIEQSRVSSINRKKSKNHQAHTSEKME